MPSVFKSLLKDTALYGISSIVGRMLNWLLTFLYVRVLLPEEFGQMSYTYAWVAIIIIFLTYGMETTLFRYTTKGEDKPEDVYRTIVLSIGAGAITAILLGGIFLHPLSNILALSDSPELTLMLLGVAALDSFNSIPLAYLRLKSRPKYFLVVYLSFVAFTILATLIVFWVLPRLQNSYPHIISSWYNPQYHIHYILGINLAGNMLQSLLLFPIIRQARIGRYSFRLLHQMLSYATPMLLLGFIGMLNGQADKIIFPRLFDDPIEGKAQLGIYSACYKLALLMTLFTQAFRYAYDPFVFNKQSQGEESARQDYADSMKYYVIVSLLIFVGIMAFYDQLRYLISPQYYIGLQIVPYVMAGQLLFGIYSNLSVWYKLTDRTFWGAILSATGAILTIGTIILFAPSIGFMACALALLLGNAVITLLSYFLGKKYFPIPYDLSRMGLYALLALGLSLCYRWVSSISTLNQWVVLIINLSLTLLYLLFILRMEVSSSTLIHIKQRAQKFLSK